MNVFARLRRFARAREGLAALEFALIAPMMIFVLFGSIELVNAMEVNRRVQNTAASLSDLIARDKEVSDDEIAGIWSTLDVLMYPNDGESMDVRITSISITSATEAKVVWSEVHNDFDAINANTAVTDLPSGMMRAGTSLIRTETAYNYHPPLNILFGGAVQINHTVYRRSRLVDPIPRVD